MSSAGVVAECYYDVSVCREAAEFIYALFSLSEGVDESADAVDVSGSGLSGESAEDVWCGCGANETGYVY